MKIRDILPLFVLVAFYGCNKEAGLNIDEPDFDVKVSSETYSVNEDVVFEFTGNAEFLTFFSGELYKEYAYREGRVLDSEGGNAVSFTSAVDKGSQANQLSVLISTDFDGNYDDVANINNQNWTDVTNRFTLGTNATFVSSGERSIADIVEPGKPVYIAFKYKNRAQLQHGEARIWMIQEFKVFGNTAIGKVQAEDLNTTGFRIIDENPVTHPARSAITTTRISMQGNEYTDNWDPEGDHWAISKPVMLDKINLGPDRPTILKSSENPMPDNLVYRFSKPGVYQVTFVGVNHNIYHKKEKVKTIQLTITP